MSGMRRFVLAFLVLLLALLTDLKFLRAAENRATVYDTGNSNLLSPTPSQAPKPLPAAATPAEPNAPPAKSPSLLQLLEGRERDVMLWAAIAATFFFLGWICGGNYYVRRDRVKRTRLRF